MSTIIVIPARMASTRLPGKPLASVGGEAMIVQVWRRAVEADVGRVVVAAADRVIADTVEEAGGEAVMTDHDLRSGSDRVHQALARIDRADGIDVVVNLQGDLPTLPPRDLGCVVATLTGSGADIATLAAPTTDEDEALDSNVVKVVVAWNDGEERGRALCFTRARAPWGEGPLWHHVGIYAFRREALELFVTLPESALERRERLEQMRALEAGMSIAVGRVDSVPVGVDTPRDLEQARSFFR
ncbi:MAG: 3-deoxy-manno-octulosonate cytidylyltransferase [bacterium]|nr:3-deoxy-manno-octulosonate cytidylyltransferase [bacterium]